jgi:hypothetical protein
MIALAVSNKDDEEMSYWLLKAVKDSFQILDRNHTFTCKLADNSDTIQMALHRCFSLRFDWKLHVSFTAKHQKSVHFGTLKSLKPLRSM